MPNFRPMRAHKESVHQQAERLRFPLLVSPKYDGIQALVLREVALVSRRLRSIPNHHCRKLFEHPALIGCAGELIAGPPTAPDALTRTASAVMAADTVDDVSFYLFDYFLEPNSPYTQRAVYLASLNLPKHVTVVEQTLVKNQWEAAAMADIFIQQGYEGMMLRSPMGIYKNGRSTLKEQYLLKWKLFEEREARILEVEEMMHNDNEATKDARGYTKRSKKQEGMRPAGMLGRMHLEDIVTKERFWAGGGPLLTLKNRIALWKVRQRLPDLIVNVRTYPKIKDKPRSPRVYAFRDKIDL